MNAEDKDDLARVSKELTTATKKITEEAAIAAGKSKSHYSVCFWTVDGLVKRVTELRLIKERLSLFDHSRDWAMKDEKDKALRASIVQEERMAQDNVLEQGLAVLDLLKSSPDNPIPVLARPQLAQHLQDFYHAVSNVGLSTALPKNFFAVTKRAKAPEGGISLA